MNILEAKQLLHAAGYKLIKEKFEDYTNQIDIDEIAELANTATYESLYKIINKLAEVTSNINPISVSEIKQFSNDNVAKLCKMIYNHATNATKPTNVNLINIINTVYSYI